VLIVHHMGLFGALGLSRKCDLAYKPLVFTKLSSIIGNYRECYEKYFHQIKKINIGLPISHDSNDRNIPNWNFLSINDLENASWDTVSIKVDKYAIESRRALNDYNLSLKVCTCIYIYI
jgi:hypothetical protein